MEINNSTIFVVYITEKKELYKKRDITKLDFCDVPFKDMLLNLI
jgi:hypothetical protein